MRPPTIPPHLAGDCTHLQLLTLRGLGGAVAQHHVTQLVGHHAGHFAVGPGRTASIPRLRNMGPPGRAKALISLNSTTSNGVTRKAAYRRSSGMFARRVDAPAATYE